MRALVLMLAASVSLAAQSWDCVQFFTFTAVGSTASADNRQNGCTNWFLGYESSGFTAVSLRFESADGATAPGAFGAFSGSVVSGVNPQTNTVRGSSEFTGYVGWWRVTLTSTMGAGTLRGVLYGFKAGYSASFPPPVPYNALTSCPNPIAVTTTAMGSTQLVAPVMGQTITVCHVSESFAAAVDWQLQTSTGAACAGAAALSGLYKSILTIALDTPFVLPVGDGLCVNLGAAVTGGGLLIYGQK